MKVLHTSDWHLGIELHRHSLLEDQRWFLTQLYQIIQKETIDVVLISGDIYDTTLATKEAIELFDDAMKTICQDMKKQVIVIAGNHDSSTRLSAMKALLKPSGLHLYGTLDHRPQSLTIEDVDFTCIPFVHKETLSGIYGTKFTSYEQAFLTLMEDVRKNKKTNKQIVLAHAFVSGATLSESDRFAMVGSLDMISKDVFHSLDYVALGHLHQPQVLDKHIVYSGSPLAYSFSETKPKHVVIIDTNDMTYKNIEIKPLHPLTIVKGTYEEVMETLCDLQEAYVKVELTDASPNYEWFHYMKERCPYLLCVTSKNMAQSTDRHAIEFDGIQQLQDEDIIKQFFLDTWHRELSEEELRWMHEVRKGESE